MNNKKDEALKMALECVEAWDRGCDRDPYWRDIEAAIIAIREALAEQPAQQEPVGDDWTPCMKLPVVVHVRKQRHGEAHVSTREGLTPVKPDDLIMRGISGEEYPIGRAIFEQTYTLNTTPQPSKPLTDEEIILIVADCASSHQHTDIHFARAIEAAHGIKEKNNG